MSDQASNVRCLRALFLSLLAAAFLAASGGAEERKVEEVLAEFDSKIAVLETGLQEDPDHPTAWRELLELRLFRRAISGEAKDSTREETVEYQRRSYREWIAAQPWNGGGYIGYGATLPLEERADYLSDALTRAPSSVELLKMTLWVLTTAGEDDRARRAADQFLIDNPADPKGFELVYNHMLRQKNGERAREVLEAWLEGVPGDGPALLIQYREDLRRSRSDPERAALATELARQVELDGRGLNVCADLRGESFDDLARDCYQRALAAGLGASETERARKALLEMGVGLDWSSRLAAAAQLPEGDRSAFLAQVALEEAQGGHCDDAIRILEAPGFDGARAAHPFMSIYDACGHGGPFEDRLQAITTQFSDRGLEYLLRTWPRNQPFDFLESEALGRLRSGGGEATLWTSLDQLYEKSGLTNKRLELYSRWRRADPQPESLLMVKRWIEFLRWEGAPEELEHLLVEVTRPGAYGEGYSYLGELADFYVVSGRMAEAADAIERMQEIENRSAGLARHRQSDIHVARLAWTEGDLGAAEAAYRGYLEADFNFSGDAFREYCYLLASSERPNDLFTALEELYTAASRAPDLRVRGSIESWVATRLQEVYLSEPALEYLDRAIVRQPENGELHERAYRLAFAVGDKDRAREALEALVVLDPRNPTVHDRLVAFRMSVEGADATLDELDRLPAGMEASSSHLRARRAAALIDAGEIVEGIRILRLLEVERPDDSAITEQLGDAYRLLGEQENNGEEQP